MASPPTSGFDVHGGVSRVQHANGRLIVFKNDNKLVVHEVGCSGVSEVSSRYT